MNVHHIYMQRCFDLARLGAGKASPNPMVGSVLVHQGKIIGEGYHHKYGTAHAEVNAIRSVSTKNRHLIPYSTLYVSLEPCCIFGKTPPCTHLIIKEKIPKVVISCLDLTPEVAGNGVQILQESGIEVVTGILEKEGQALSAIRNTFVSQHRPYIILKYAQSQNGMMGKATEQVWISHPYSKRLVHRWRNEADAILVGTNTAQIDNPQLNNRLYFGKSPIRIVLDRQLRLHPSLHLFDKTVKTWVITEKNPPKKNSEQLEYIKLFFDNQFIFNLLKILAEKKISSLIVEGGQKVLQSFITAQVWDEARVLVGQKIIKEGITAPKLNFSYRKKHKIGQDKLYIYRNFCEKK